jgi:hypothetical protein
LHAGKFSPLIQNLWLGSVDADALMDMSRPQLNETKKQVEALLVDVIRLQVALEEGIDVATLVPSPQEAPETGSVPVGSPTGDVVAPSGEYLLEA